MKKQFYSLKLFLPVLFILFTFSSKAQEFTLTTTAANTVSSKSLIDLPGLTGNSNAIIIATPVGNTSNPHPTGVWYYSGKWNLFNTNHAAMPLGLTYKIQYFQNPGPNQFLHLVTQQNLGTEGSYIDNPALNSKPNVHFTIFQNHSPDVRPGSLNPYEAKTGYSTAAGKWYITNTGNQPLLKGSAYNIVISAAATSTSTGSNTNPPNNSSTAPCNCPASLPPNGNAGGDLSGTYPNPAVQKLLGRPLSNTAPATGQVLKWNGSAWYPANDNAGSGGIATLETWKTNGANISNVNTGNIGIGNSDPAYRLDISNRMRIRSGGNNSVSAGLWLNNNANAEAAFMGMEDDTHVGFFGHGGAGWKFSMNTQTGALKINGTEGTAGQVLISNGAGNPATWSQPAGGITTPTLQTFFKTDNEQSPSLGMNGTYTFTTHTYPITVAKKSRLIISGNFLLSSAANLVDIYSTKLGISLLVNGVHKGSLCYEEMAPRTSASGVFANYMIDLVPGTYSIQFQVSHPWIDGNVAGYASARYTSIIVIPL